MSDEARYMRLMHVVREPNLERVRSVLASFPEAGIGIVATVPAADGIDIVGSAIRDVRKRPDKLRVRDYRRRRIRRHRAGEPH
jgi:hypothetical protein